jgi:hypothetical protein
MDAVNELSCEFAATILNKMKTSEQLEPQAAANLIRNFYNALFPLMEQESIASMKKFPAQDVPGINGQSAACGH